MGETISLSVLSQSAPADQVVKQIETPRSPDPIMRRPCADREEKRVTRGSDTAGSRKHRSGDACLTDPNQRRLLDQTYVVCLNRFSPGPTPMRPSLALIGAVAAFACLPTAGGAQSMPEPVENTAHSTLP